MTHYPFRRRSRRRKMSMHTAKVILTISGPSGGGKTLLEHWLLKRFPKSRIITATDRVPRVGENQDEYYFLAKAELQERGDWLWNVDVFNDGIKRALARSEVERALTEGDGFGFMNITTMGSQHQILDRVFGSQGVKIVKIFLESPGEAELRRRMRVRGDKAKDIENRIQKARMYRKNADSIPGMHFIQPTTPASVEAQTLALIEKHKHPT